MDALGVLNHLSGIMTPEEWAEFRDSEEGLWMRARVEGYRGAAMQKLVEAGKRRRSEAWEIALDMANNIISAEAEEIPLVLEDEQRTQLVTRLAEKLLCEQNVTPPTFTAWTDCATCDRVPVPEGTDLVTPNCPWCSL